MRLHFVLLLLFLSYLGTSVGEKCAPRLAKIQIGEYYSDQENPTTAKVSFQTYGECRIAEVRVTYENQTTQLFGGGLIVPQKWTGQEFCFHDCQEVYYDQYTHIIDLQVPTGVSFNYEILSRDLNGVQYVSELFQTVLPNVQQEENEPVEYLFFGDFDQTEPGELTWTYLDNIYHEKEKWNISHFIFLGDYAYEFWQQNGTKGDQLLQRFQKYMTKWPYTITAGNHEQQYNFSFFNQKFQMIDYDKYQNFFYSYNMGLVHFISLNIQYFNQSVQSIKDQMKQWLQNDLIQANQNRQQRPWIIAFSHYFVYNNDTDNDFYYLASEELDEIFYQYNVDILLSGHKHKYEFITPLYKNKVMGFTEIDGTTLINPKSYIQVIQGNGGNVEMMPDSQTFSQPALESSTISGIGRLIVLNSTTLIIQAFESLNQTVIMNYTLISDHNYNPSQKIASQ